MLTWCDQIPKKLKVGYTVFMHINISLSDELTWRGFNNQTTLKDPSVLDGEPITFYVGMDPSASSITIGNLAIIMMVKRFIAYGHKPVLLVGGATGLIGDPDGKVQERDLKTPNEVTQYTDAIAMQYRKLLGEDILVVNNYDWFKDFSYLDFLRNVGKHVPMRTMLGRDFVQKRLGEEGSGISYAEFSYSLIQGYDYVHLNREHNVTLQLCGADQWGNSIAGVDLVRRMNGAEVHIWSAPLVINKTTGKKFGKSEDGAVWLDPAKTTPTAFYQFWMNVDDAGVEDYLKVYTELSREAIEAIIDEHTADPQQRHAQRKLAEAVTTFVHGETVTQVAEQVTQYLTGVLPVSELDDQYVLESLRGEIAAAVSDEEGSIIDALEISGLAESKSAARRLLQGNAISINGIKVTRENFEASDFHNGRLLLRKGKKFKDSALIELK